MKILLFLVIVLSFGANAKSFSQNQKVSLEIKQATILEVLNEIKEQTGLYFIYKKGLFDEFDKISIEVENEEVKIFLDKLLLEKGLECEVEEEVITFKELVKPVLIKEVQEKKKIKGTVTDEDGNTLPGVSVVVKGIANGVATDINGKYILEMSGDKAVIVFSFIGMISQVVVYKGQLVLDIRLVTDSEQMDEIVVTGYQKIRKTRMTGSVESVSAAKIANRGFTSVAQTIKGQMAGVSMISTSGRPGAAAQIRIRGVNTLTGDAEPIWIVDGMPLQGEAPKVGVGGSGFTSSVLSNGIGNISVDDIESITVLKDAAASAIYGSRAANGVIVVTTKRGTSGKSYLNYRSSYSINAAPRNNLQLMNTQEKMSYEESIYNDFSQMNLKGRVFRILKHRAAGSLTYDEAARELEILRNTKTNWYDEIFRTSYSQNHSLSLQGGSDKTQFYSSLNYQNETGIVPNNEYSNYGITLKLTHNFTDKLRINFDVSSNYKEDRTTASSINPLHYATFANPYERLLDENGAIAYDRSYESTLSKKNVGYVYDLNILEDINNNTTKSNYLTSGLNLKIEYELLKGLMFATQASFSSSNTTSKRIYEPGSYTSERNSWIQSVYQDGEIPDDMNNGSLKNGSSRSLNYTLRNSIAYNTYIKKNHFINIMAGQEVSSRKTEDFSVLSPEYDPEYDLIGFPELQDIKGEKLEVNGLNSIYSSEHKTASFFATATYSYKDKYVFSTSGRMDGVDIIGTDNRFTPLWNTSLKYNIAKEKFMEDFWWLDILSFRGSFGYTGSIDYNAKPFATLRYSKSSRKLNGEVLPYCVYSANPSIKWQKKTDRSLGLDLSIFKNRINATVNYYSNITKDLLDTKQLPISNGKPTVKANVASLKNKGLECSINTKIIDTEDFRWNINFNITFNKNSIIDTYYKSLEDLPVIERKKSVTKSYFIKNRPTQSWYGYKFAGVNTETGHMMAYIDKKDNEGNQMGHKREDGSYVIDMNTEFTKDAVAYLGNSYPTFSGGFGTSLSYKRFNLNANFTYMGGHKIRSFRSSTLNPLYASKLNTSVNEFYRWRKNGDVTHIPVLTTNQKDAYNKYFFDSELEDGDFLKFSNASLTYNLTSKCCSKLKLTRLTIGVSATNIYTWSKYKGVDPETMGAFAYPNSRRYSFNLNLGI